MQHAGALVYGNVNNLKTDFLEILDCKYTKLNLARNPIPEKQAFARGALFSIYFKLSSLSLKINYQLSNKIAEGSYGTVFILNQINQPGSSPYMGMNNNFGNKIPTQLTIKVPKMKNGVDDDLKIINLLEIQGDPVNLFIDTCVLEMKIELETPDSENNKFMNLPILLMERMDGSLNTFKLPVDLDIYSKYAVYYNILIQVLDGYSLLFEKGYYYTDCKAENILYRVNEPGLLEIFISDLGGANNDIEAKSFSVTYPYIFRKSNDFKKRHVADFIYGVMIIFLQLNSEYFSSTNPLTEIYWSNQQDNLVDNVRIMTESIVNLFDEIGSQVPEDLRYLNRLMIQLVIGKNLLFEDEITVLNNFKGFLLWSYKYIINFSNFGKKYLYLPVKLPTESILDVRIVNRQFNNLSPSEEANIMNIIVNRGQINSPGVNVNSVLDNSDLNTSDALSSQTAQANIRQTRRISNPPNDNEVIDNSDLNTSDAISSQPARVSMRQTRTLNNPVGNTMSRTNTSGMRNQLSRYNQLGVDVINTMSRNNTLEMRNQLSRNNNQRDTLISRRRDELPTLELNTRSVSGRPLVTAGDQYANFNNLRQSGINLTQEESTNDSPFVL